MNETTAHILALLRAEPEWVSGEDIGVRLEISRAAVSKQIALLRKDGYTIESSPRRGYLLRNAPNTPNAAEVTPRLITQSFGRPLVYTRETDSTNGRASEMARNGAASGATVVADRQTAGRGRFQREWFSPSGSNLYVSVILRPTVHPARIGQLPLVAAAALVEVLDREWPSLGAGIKWPNDILVGGRKVCGILCESEAEIDLLHYVVVGIGLNLNTRTFPPKLRRIATSIRAATGLEVDRPALLANLLNVFEPLYERWLAAPDLSPLVPFLEERSALRNREVVVTNVRGKIRGRAGGIAPDGSLVLETRNGPVTVTSGDVTLTPNP